MHVVIAAEATGFPALLIIFGIIGLVVAVGIAVGIAVGGRKDRAKTAAGISAAVIVIGLILANVF